MDTFVDPKGVQEDAVRNVECVGTEDGRDGETDVDSVYEYGSEEDDCFSDLGSDDEQLIGSLYVVDCDIETEGEDDDGFCDTVLLSSFSHKVATIGTELEQKFDVHIEDSVCLSSKTSVLLVLMTAAMMRVVSCCKSYMNIVGWALESMMLKMCKIQYAVVLDRQSFGRKTGNALMRRYWPGVAEHKGWLSVPRCVPSAVELVCLCGILTLSFPMLASGQGIGIDFSSPRFVSEGYADIEMHSTYGYPMLDAKLPHDSNDNRLKDPRQTFDVMLQATGWRR